MTYLVPDFCNGIDWDAEGRHDPWRCPSTLSEYAAGQLRLVHQCAASYDHTSDHVCSEGHRWRQAKPRRRWRDRIRRRRR